MPNELTISQTQELSTQDKSKVDSQVEELLKNLQNQQTINREEIDILVREGMLALTASDKMAQEKSKQGFLKRFRKNFTGENTETQDEINSKLITSHYAIQKTLTKLAKQNLMALELIAVVNNKLNNSIVEINDNMNELAEAIKENFEQLMRQVDNLAQDVKILQWKTTINQRKYNGTGYENLDYAIKIFIVTKEFFEITCGKKLKGIDLLLLKAAMDSIGLVPDNKADEEKFIRHFSKNENYNKLIDNQERLDFLVTENEGIVFSVKERHLDPKKIFPSRNLDNFNFVLELLYNFRQLEYSKKLYEKLQTAQELFFNYKIKDAVPLLEELADSNIVKARYMLAIIYNKGFEVEKNKNFATNLIHENVLEDDPCSINFGIRLGGSYGIDICELQILAEEGEVFAQYELSQYYFKFNRTKDALEYLQLSAEQNYFLAIFELGKVYYDGRGVAQDYFLAKDYFEKLSAMGFTQSDVYLKETYFKLALKYYDKEDIGNAKIYFEKASCMEHGLANLYLGDIYSEGHSVTIDKKKAVEYYKKAYELGESSNNSINAIAFSFCDVNPTSNGNYMVKVSSEAVKWWNIGAEKNYPICIASLGWIYRDGFIVEKNLDKAIEYFERSISAGLNTGEVEKNLGDIYYSYCNYNENDTVISHDMAENFLKAIEWYEKALAKGQSKDNIIKNLANAEFGLGHYYHYSSNSDNEQDYLKATDWYKKAYEHGKKCFKYIGDCHYFSKRYQEAVEWYEKGIDDNNARCAYMLGGCYIEGNGVAQDYSTALEYFKKSIALGDSSGIPELGIAQINLGYGDDTKRDEAIQWYWQSAEKGNQTARQWLIEQDLVSWFQRLKWSL